jgi:hypothetical protein
VTSTTGEKWAVDVVKNAVRAANALKIRVGVIAVKNPNVEAPCLTEIEGAKVDFWTLMYRGRAVSKLTEKASKKQWYKFMKCPYEDFTNQQRVHIDPLGMCMFVRASRSATLGRNLFQK